MNLCAYIFTNGRSSYQYAKASLETQTVPIKIKTVKDMGIVPGMNFIMKDKEFYNYDYILKVDDDFIFHSRSLEYLLGGLPFKNSKMAMKFWHLYDIAADKSIQSVKIYNRRNTGLIGPFTADEEGRVDKIFMRKCRNKGYPYRGNESMMALHACCPRPEQLNYEHLWKSIARSKKHVKMHRKKMLNCSFSLDYQFENRDKILEKENAKSNSTFWQTTLKDKK